MHRNVFNPTQGLDSVPLRLAVTYESNEHHNITYCSFSKCGNYFAFTESPCVVAVYPLQHLAEACFTSPPVSMAIPDVDVESSTDNTAAEGRRWRALSSELLSGDSLSIDLQSLCHIRANGVVQCLAFAIGDISHCRLPHRTRKRVSRVIQNSDVSLILLGLVTGYTEVYNLFDITVPVSRIPNMLLFADSLPIYLLSVAPDTSLRLASVQLGGEVKLWDLWDDGNMYASLKRNFVFPADNETDTNLIYGEACTFAWQPYGKHICLAGQLGYGVILQSEKPFTRVATLRSGHFHRISAASYTHDGSMLLTASYDSSCAVWAVPEYTPLHHYWHMGRVPSLLLLGGTNWHHMYGLAVAPDDLTFATICEDRCIRLWPLCPTTSPVKTYYELALSSLSGPKLRSISFSPCGRLLAVTSSDNRVLIFTSPSQVTSLTVQSARVIRHCVTRHLMEKYPTQLALSALTLDKPCLSGFPNRVFCRAVSDLPLPPQLILTLFRDFRSHSQLFYNSTPPVTQ
ncbi:WD repeat and SOCS box-containing protein 1 [Paragonimus heterotremus]|uniref:WD repeat and SOCS box-containing protein 1 n=1 Tax=Paragonimus heterotremus TaxID=100268 RepID=A0A8J4T972_9TREM|nr:WD repeat and SOCS box-containing protein 1 [Paragonimus heterotremus]